MKTFKKIILLLICVSLYFLFAVASTESNGSGSSSNSSGNSGVTSDGTKPKATKTPTPTSTPKPTPAQMLVSDIKANVNDLTENQIQEIIGTYISSNGRAISIYSDGTAKQTYNPYKIVEFGDVWQYVDGIISIKSPMQNCVFTLKEKGSEKSVISSLENGLKGSASTTDAATENNVVEYELGCSLENSKTENMIKVLTEEVNFNIDEYKELIGNYYPEALITPTPSPTATPKPTATPTPSPKPTEVPIDKVVSVTVTNKSTKSALLEDYSVLSIKIKNNTKRAVRAVRGVLTVKDMFNKTISSYEIDFTGKTIDGNASATYEKNVSKNQFIDSSVKLYKEKYEDLVFSFKVEKIVYLDEVKTNKSVTRDSTEVTVECVSKKNIDADIFNEIISDYSAFEFKITNNSSKDIKGISGNFWVYNIFGECILKGGADFTGKKIPAKGSVKMTINKEINIFIDDDLAVQREKYEDMYFEYQVITIVNY